MRYLAFVFFGVTAAAQAQGIPDIKGTWSGTGRSVVFGNNPHHPGDQTVVSPPRVRDYEFTFVVDGQDGAWPGVTRCRPSLQQTSPSHGRSRVTTKRSSEPIPTAISI